MTGLILQPDHGRTAYRVPIRFRVPFGASQWEIEKERNKAADQALVGLGKQGWEWVGSSGDFIPNPVPRPDIPVLDVKPQPIRRARTHGRHPRGLDVDVVPVPNVAPIHEYPYVWFEMIGTFARPTIVAEVREEDLPLIERKQQVVHGR